MKLECERCQSTHNLTIVEKLDKETGELKKVFVCVRCSDDITEHR